MKTHVMTVLIAALFAGAPLLAAAAATALPEHGTESEAQEMVKKAVALVKSAGDGAYKTLTEHPSGAFKDRDLYVYAYDFKGNCLAHGRNSKIVGKNMIDLKDVDGKDIIKDEIAMIKAKGSGWYGPFRFANPANNMIEAKRTFCMRGAGETMVCAVAYSEQ